MTAATAAVTTGHISVQPFRPVFLASPGRPPVPWGRWHCMFEDWLMAVGFPDDPTFAARKAALLRASLGTEGFRLYSSLTPEAELRESYDAAVVRLRKHFGQPASAIFARAQFTRCQQRPGQSVTQYVAALREMAAKCDFSATQLDERVRDQFVAWCVNDRIRERLLQEPATKSLDELLDIAVTVERALVEAPALSAQPSSIDLSIGRVQGRSDRKPMTSATFAMSAPCGNCGQVGHAARSDGCPARDQRCRHCDRRGHYEKCCRQRQQHGQRYDRRRSQSRRRRHGNTNRVDGERQTDDVAAGDVHSVKICTLDTAASGTFKWIKATLDGVPIVFLIDLGARVSIISQTFYDEHLAHRPLTPSPFTLRTYDGQPISCRGCITVDTQIAGKKPIRFQFHVAAHGESLLGVDLFDALDGRLQLGETTFGSTNGHSSATVAAVDRALQSVTETSTVTLADYPTLLTPSGTLRGFVHRPMIDTSVKPVQQRFWHPPLATREPVEREIRRMEREGVIEKIDASPWISNLVPARKKDGSVRVCINLSAANKALIIDKYPLPTMEEMTSQLAGNMVFTKIDLLWGYTQLELCPSARYLTAFVCHLGVYQWCRLPFGMASGPSAYHKVIREILEGLPGCTSILDDILVYGKSMAEHDRHLRGVLSRLAKYNATVRVDKCVIGKSEVEFNGHVVSAAGLRPLQSNVDSILRIPVPVNQRQLLRFLCTASYYLKFVDGYASLSEPLRCLLRANVDWNWTPECQNSFDEIKRRLTTPPTLAHFDTEAETIVTCDASSVGIAACLSQRRRGDNVERPVAFISRALSPTEQRYSASEREALACMWSCERLNFFLYGRRFRLVTDHQALRTLLTAGGSGHRPLRLHRWADRLLQYDFDVVYKPGKDNVVSDCLSRAYEDKYTAPPPAATEEVTSSQTDDEDAWIQTLFGSLSKQIVSFEAVAAATDADPILRTVRDYVINGWPTDRRQLSPDMRVYFSFQHELSVSGNCIVRGVRTVIPSALTAQLLELAHEGHPGIVRMKQRCRQAVWWVGIDTDIEHFVRECTACVLSGKSVAPRPGPLQPLPLPTGPWQKLSIDIAGEFQAAPDHQRYLIVAVDLYSKWVEVTACSTVTTSSIVNFLSTLFERYGLIQEVVTDNGVQFTSHEFASFLSIHGIRHSRAAFYAPQANAAVERVNRVIKEGLKAGLADGKTFMAALRQVVAGYRTTPHATTGVSPASLMLAFPVRTPLSLLAHPIPAAATQSRQAMERRVRFQQEKMAEHHDRRTRAVPTNIKPGDCVRILLPRRPHKLAPSYSDPYPVARVKGNTVWLQNGQRWNVRRCIRQQSSIRQATSAGQLPTADPPSSNREAAPTDDDEEQNGPTFSFAIGTPVRRDRTPGPRRSGRRRVQRDLGPVISH